jgi:hypothetical protein
MFKHLLQKPISAQPARIAQTMAVAFTTTAPKTLAKVFIARGVKKVRCYLTPCGPICRA